MAAPPTEVETLEVKVQAGVVQVFSMIHAKFEVPWASELYIGIQSSETWRLEMHIWKTFSIISKNTHETK